MVCVLVAIFVCALIDVYVCVLLDISHLFPYVTPHIYKKWHQFALALGLCEADLTDIVVTPHEKQSRYVHMVLEIWLEKDKSKATKEKLTQALQAIGAKKALGMLFVVIM